MTKETATELLVRNPSELTEEQQALAQSTMDELLFSGNDEKIAELVGAAKDDDIHLHNLLVWADSSLTGPFELPDGRFAWSFIIGGALNAPEGDFINKLDDIPSLDRAVAAVANKRGFTSKVVPLLFDPYLKTDEILSSGHLEELDSAIGFFLGNNPEVPPNETDAKKSSGSFEKQPVNLVFILTHDNVDADPYSELIDEIDDAIEDAAFPVSYEIGTPKHREGTLEISYIGFAASAFIDHPYHLDVDDFFNIVASLRQQIPDFEAFFVEEKTSDGTSVIVEFNNNGEDDHFTHYESSMFANPRFFIAEAENILSICRATATDKDPFAGCSETMH